MKIITWNTQWCKGLDGRVDIARVVDVAREMADFDVLCLQEIAVNYPDLTGDTPADQPAALRQLLPGFEVFFSASIDELSPDGTYRQQFGNLIATRLPVRQVQHVALPYPNPPPDSALAENVLSMQRVCLVCTVQAEWGPVRLMTSHLEFYSQPMRLAQARALRDWHRQSCALAAYPPKSEPGTPYQPKSHTVDANLCGDFNFEQSAPEHAAILETWQGDDLVNGWEVLHPGQPQPATFRLFDRTYGPEPEACDFFFVSTSLKSRLTRMTINQLTQVSDHQPVLLEVS